MRGVLRDTLTHEFGLTVDMDFHLTPRVTIGRQHGLFDLAATLGKTSLTNVWAFNVASLDSLERDIQSWNFIVSRLREDGAEVNLRGGASRVIASDAPIQVVIDPPRSKSGQRIDVYEAALEAWAKNDVRVGTLPEFHQEPARLLAPL